MILEQTLKQAGILSPQMIQSMEILQMSSYELERYLQNLALENPTMELHLPSRSPEVNAEEFGRRLQWLEDNDRQNAFYLRGDEDDGEYDSLARAGTDGGLEADLYSHLSGQLDGLPGDTPCLAAAKFLAGCLDEHGYLDDSPEKLAEEAGLPAGAMEAGLELLRSLDPPGVGARNLSECLVLQLERMGEKGFVLDIAAGYLDELSRQRYKFIAGELHISQEQVRLAAEKIRALEPRPGESFKRSAPPVYIVPDIFVTERDGFLAVTSNSDAFPRLKISSCYRRLLNSTSDPEVKLYLDEKIRQVRYAIRSVNQRSDTLLSCAREIVSRQEKFFLHGDRGLAPMTHRDIAAAMGVHDSTVGRAIREKYLQCAHGIYPLSYFFTRAVGDIGSRRVQQLICELIDAEDKSHPLSDQKLCGQLESRGCGVSRRTVTKYRDQLGIPDASRRKQP
ncbi:MAG: RNA polymerase factor sigma-54 [Candidatus Heteroscillospira sp.]